MQWLLDLDSKEKLGACDKTTCIEEHQICYTLFWDGRMGGLPWKQWVFRIRMCLPQTQTMLVVN